MSVAISQETVGADDRAWVLTPLGHLHVEQLRRWQAIESAADARRQGRAAGAICAHCPSDFRPADELDPEARKLQCRHGGIAAHAQCESAEDDERGAVDAEGDEWEMEWR